MNLLESIWKSAVLGTVQGLAEFLPVSSSGHLTLLQRVLGYDLAGGSMTFINIMLHLGTLVAIFIVFWKDIWALFKKPFKTLGLLILATVPAGVVGILFEDQMDAMMAGEQGLLYLAIFFAFTALILLVCEFVAKHRKKVQPLGLKHSVCMGLMQAVALFPGISRSGSTIVAGTLSGAKTEDVSRFSFLMSIPVVLGSFLVSMKGVVFDTPEVMTQMGTNGWLGLAVGILCSALFGFLAIKFMLKIINKANYKWFSLYLVLLSLTCVWLDVLNLFPVVA